MDEGCEGEGDIFARPRAVLQISARAYPFTLTQLYFSARTARRRKAEVRSMKSLKKIKDMM